ncbi:hypothetical protein [uncultured Chloroflexus sp.]|uniref:hypothetical protein n=1 Tax=uncultured Chloroflexus sp. TaxID=214040 RepID=UPI0026284BF4|nr:hypothetical protein [uncultured Chloroflexus sp.]
MQIAIRGVIVGEVRPIVTIERQRDTLAHLTVAIHPLLLPAIGAPARILEIGVGRIVIGNIRLIGTIERKLDKLPAWRRLIDSLNYPVRTRPRSVSQIAASDV